MKKRKRVSKKNQGNSFIVVVATISFLTVLCSALLVAVALCFRLKAYDINTRDNFYYLERAMDEIYAGVGADSMQHLNQAYDDTLEVLVYYDAKSKSYVTMENKDANAIMKDTFMYLVRNDSNYTDAKITGTLTDFISNQYSSSNTEGIQLSVDSCAYDSSIDKVVIKKLVLKREAAYSTVNARSGSDAGAADTFVQSITTDIVIGKPEFDVNFTTGATGMNDLYSFALISDKGIEIAGKDNKTAYGNKVTITGDIYAAADFYNKDYDELTSEQKKAVTVPSGFDETKLSAVSSYDKNENQYKKCDGVSEKSAYSGLYVDGASVTIAADKLIVPGTIAAMNCASLSISNFDNSSAGYANVWTDSIVLGGFSLKKTVDGKTLQGAQIGLKGNVYVSDDLELNANSAVFTMNGGYYGYNYATTDNRTYSSSVQTLNNRSFASAVDKGLTDGMAIEGQAHYNSSAIILNGENTTLDLEAVSAMYVAGQSYIELSKDKSTAKTQDSSGKSVDMTQTVTYKVNKVDKDGKMLTDTESVTEDFTYEKIDYTDADYDQKGLVTDNYTDTSGESTDQAADEGVKGSSVTVRQDYRTGEAISIKSNQLAYQLAYIPNAIITDKDGELYVSLPDVLRDKDPYKDMWDDLAKVPIVKTVVSGNVYYFFDFSKAKKSAAMNQFIEDYANLFNRTTEGVPSVGENNNLVNITDYEYFKVKMLHLYDTDINGNATESNPYNKIYTNSAITTTEGNVFTIRAKSSSIAPLLQAKANINAATTAGNRGEVLSFDENTDSDVAASAVTTQLQSQYKEMKWLLTNESADSDAVTEAHTLNESVLTPLNYYLKMHEIDADEVGYTVAISSAISNDIGVWVSDGDIVIDDDTYTIDGTTYNYTASESAGMKGKAFSDNSVRGLVIAKGDVTFSDDVNEFTGMIISGGKIIINNFSSSKNSMRINADRESIKNVLDTLDMRRGDDAKCGKICDLFRLFTSQYVPETSSGETAAESMKTISSVEFEDILSFENWVKNVD